MGDYPEAERVDADGLPFVGTTVWPGQSYYTTINKTNGERRLVSVTTGLSHLHVMNHGCEADCAAPGRLYAQFVSPVWLHRS